MQLTHLRKSTHFLSLIFCVMMLSQLGCRSLPVFQTNSHIHGHVDGTVSGAVKTEVDLKPPSAVNNQEELTEMEVVAGKSGKIAIIDLDGLLVNKPLTGIFSAGENPVSVFREKLDHVEKSNFDAVVVRINSPGGGVTAADIMWRDLKGFRDRTDIPVVACLMDTAAGGAYYIAAGCDNVVAHPTSVIGGVGVILNLYFLEDLMSQINVVGVPIRSGKNIDMGTPIREMSDEQRDLLQQIAVDFHERFKKVVITGRPEFEAESSQDVFDGRVFTSKEAKTKGLVDTIGYLEDAITTAQVLCQKPDANVVLLRRPNDKARTPYAISPNNPGASSLVPINVPGINRSQMPTFLYLWQPNPTVETIGG